MEAPSKARLRLWLKLLKASRAIESELREKLRREFDSTLPRFDVMSALHRHPEGLKMSQLSGVLKVANGNVTGIVDRLVDEGVVVRLAVEGDRRASLVRLTPKGAEQFAVQAAAHETWVDRLMAALTAEQVEDMARNIDVLIPKGEDGRVRQ